MCTFWLVEALTRAGRVDSKKLNEARLIFEQMLGYANHLASTPKKPLPAEKHWAIFPRHLPISL
jgi:hypothetical protein